MGQSETEFAALEALRAIAEYQPLEGTADPYQQIAVHSKECARKALEYSESRAVRAERARCASFCDAFDSPVSSSDFVNGQATAAQQIRAAILGGGEPIPRLTDDRRAK